jgi:hypothetical protein
MRQFLLFAASALSVILLARPAHADDNPDASRASALFEEGRRSLAARDYVAACPKLAESLALDPRPDTALDLGICYQRASQVAFKAAHDLAPPAEQVGSRLGDDDDVGIRTQRGVEGNGVISAPSGAAVLEGEASSKGQSQRIVGLTIGGAGVVGVVVGVIAGLMAKSAYDDAMSVCAGSLCSPSGVSQRQSAHNLATGSTISFVTGAVALGAGAIVFFTSPKSRTGASATVGLAPAADGAGLAVGGRF